MWVSRIEFFCGIKAISFLALQFPRPSAVLLPVDFFCAISCPSGSWFGTHKSADYCILYASYYFLYSYVVCAAPDCAPSIAVQAQDSAVFVVPPFQSRSIHSIFTIPYKPCTARPHIWSILRLASRYGPARGREDENGRSSEKGFHCKTRKMQQDAGIIMVMLTVCWIDCVILEYQFLGLFIRTVAKLLGCPAAV